MGVWSDSIYGNDISCDTRDEYVFWLRKQCSNEEAYLRSIETFSELLQTDEKNYFWEALADTQWKVGRLSETVKQNAINEAKKQALESIDLLKYKLEKQYKKFGSMIQSTNINQFI